MELSGLPVDIENLLNHRRIESDGIEFKEGEILIRYTGVFALLRIILTILAAGIL